ncbi:hypothetical protein GGR56DRAFT_343136 [Xylariaceae sp. FL0804]|nr:hypothetical protein GGR56DRAFT_343136 [Xylariaceae sp. FL0804]
MSSPPSDKVDADKAGNHHRHHYHNYTDEDDESRRCRRSSTAAAGEDRDRDGGGAAVEDDAAVDDSEDLPDDTAGMLKKQMSDGRRRRRPSPAFFDGLRDLLPFRFAPNLRPLTAADLESCVALEAAAFANPDHRCSREKLAYRLKSYPELCFGVFNTVLPSKAGDFEIGTLKTALPVETSRKDGAVSVMMAHIIATRSHGLVVTDHDMDYPRDQAGSPNKSGLGHKESGRTICIHSLAVDPKLHGCGMGKLIMKAYLQQVKNAQIADRISLICPEYLVNYYKRFGFEHVGLNRAESGSRDWHDMGQSRGEAIPSTCLPLSMGV